MKGKFILLILLIQINTSFSQTLYESRFGFSTAPTGTYRILIVFAEIEYDGSCISDPYGINPEWATGELPMFKDELIDLEPLSTPVNYITKYFHEMSAGNLIVVGDYYPEVITINCSDASVGGYEGTSNVTDYLDNMAEPLETFHGYLLNDFDTWTNTGGGVEKSSLSDNLLDAVAIIWRNNTYIGDGTSCASGYAFQNLGGAYPIQTMTDCALLASFNACAESNAKEMIVAEYFHTLFGGNNWHSGSGAGYSTFQSAVSSYSMTAQSASMAQVACGWDRQQMGWYGYTDDNLSIQKTELISALDVSRNEINTAITIENYPDGGEFILRDFIRTNDALQIRLPHLNWAVNGDVKNQYLWVENHQQISEFDHSKAIGCADWIPGMLAYIQVGKNIRQSFTYGILYPSEYAGDLPKENAQGNWLFPLSAEGSFDDHYLYDEITNANVDCLWGNYSLPKDKTLAIPNSFTGYSDLYFKVSSDGDEQFDAEDTYQPGFSYYDNLLDEIIHTKYCYGDAGDVFTLFGNNKISIASNPSATPVYTYRSNSYDAAYPTTLASWENRTIYLNGLSVEILSESLNPNTALGNELKVKVRWDDYSVNQDVRWCGNIVLQDDVNDPLNRQSQIILEEGIVIKLERGKSPTQHIAEEMIDGEWIFTEPTILTLKVGTKTTLKKNSCLLVNENSTLVIESGAEVLIKEGAQLHAENGGKIILEAGAIVKLDEVNAKILVDNYGELIIQAGENDLELLSSTSIVIENGGTLTLEGNDIFLNSSNATIELHSGGTIQTAPNVDFTFTGAGYLHYEAGGIFNLGSNSRFVLQGTGTTDMKAWLQDDADLYIYDRDVYLEDCKIVYNNNSKLRTAFAELYAVNVLFNDGGTHADNGIHVYDTDSFEVMQCTFDGFDIPILIENIDMCPEDIVNVQIRQSTLKNYDTWGIDANTVDRMYLYANSIEGNANATAGMFLYDVIECHIEAGVIKNHSAANGVMLNNTRYFILDGATIRNNSKGIESYNSSIYLRNLATIKNNTNEGIHAFSSVDGIANPSSLRKIVVGDEGCGWIINNGTGIAGEDIALHIDAMEHAIANDGPVYPNRFDGNTDAIDICYDYFDDTYISATLMARYNYWTGGSAPIGSDVSLGFNAGCNDITKETSGYLTTTPTSCTCAGANCEEEMDEAALTLRMNDNSCAYLINQQGGGRISVAAQFNDAYQLFMEHDYNYAYQKFKWLKNRVEAEYTNGLPNGSCKLLYDISYWMVDDMALIAEAHCQPPFYDERYAAATATADIFSLYPNPATEQVTLASTLLQEVHYTIYTLDGRFIESGRFTGSKVCGIAHYTPGLYLVQLQADGQQQTMKWVVE